MSSVWFQIGLIRFREDFSECRFWQLRQFEQMPRVSMRIICIIYNINRKMICILLLHILHYHYIYYIIITYTTLSLPPLYRETSVPPDVVFPEDFVAAPAIFSNVARFDLFSSNPILPGINQFPGFILATNNLFVALYIYTYNNLFLASKRCTKRS